VDSQLKGVNSQLKGVDLQLKGEDSQGAGRARDSAVATPCSCRIDAQIVSGAARLAKEVRNISGYPSHDGGWAIPIVRGIAQTPSHYGVWAIPLMMDSPNPI
jgi:hypothetical protein